MELDKFVEKTLVQILEGVKSAQDNTDLGVINPMVNLASTRHVDIKFDVAVTVEDQIGSDGGAKIKVFGSEVGGSVQGKRASETVTKIAFEIPVKYSAGNTYNE